MAGPGAKVPRHLAGVDLTKLPLSPLEGFVVSRIDGIASVAMLADLTSLDEQQVHTIVERLIKLGAIEWSRESVSLPRAVGRAATGTPTTPFSVPDSLRSPPPAKVDPPRSTRHNQSGSHALPLATDTVYKTREAGEERVDPARHHKNPSMAPLASHTGAMHEPGAVEYDDMGSADTLPPPPPDPIPFLEEEEDAVDPRDFAPSDVAPPPETVTSSAPPEEVDLDEQRRRRIDDLYVALDLLDHYQVLGIRRDSPKEEVRTAYFQLSKVFHPDTMFRKRLGKYKMKMEGIFKRLTEGYEVLGKKRSREEYDRYLAATEQTRVFEQIAQPDEVAEARVELASDAAQAELADVLPPEIAPPPIPERTMSPEAKSRARDLIRKKLVSAARDSESRRLRSVDVGPRVPSTPPRAPADPKEMLRSLTSSIKDSAAQTGGLDQIQRHVLSAKRAEQGGDMLAAARELRLATAMAPEREDLRREHARVSSVVAGSLATSYEEQALYETRHGKWAAAALSWARVFEGRPDDARAARLAAEALVEAKGDLHRAKELAQRAAELKPDDVENLRALGRVYIAAGLPLNARRVLQRAATLDPGDEMVENLLRDLER